MTLPYSASSLRSSTALASMVLARSTAVLHTGAATGATLVVSELRGPGVTLGLGVAEEAPATEEAPA